MAHRRNFSARTIDMAKVSLESPPVTPALAVFDGGHVVLAVSGADGPTALRGILAALERRQGPG